MPATLFVLPLLARATPSPVPPWLQWLFVWGDPGFTDGRWFGAPITWMKVVGLFCLIGWILARVVSATRIRGILPYRRPGLAVLGTGLILGLFSTVIQVLDQTGRLKLGDPGGNSAGMIPGWVAVGLLVLWVEALLWSVTRKLGEAGDLLVLVGIHLALGLGIAVGYLIQKTGGVEPNWPLVLTSGARMGATYMGLVVLARVAALLLRELFAVRFRRLYSIGWLTWTEAFRRMWAPWVVVIVFGVILAFTDWFLAPPRPAELGRLYVSTLALLSSMLLTAMVAILVPISLPNDIRQQTIYTVVSKPVRRMELIWGRILGFMALVTLLLLIFGGISLIYLERNVGGTINAARAAARRAEAGGKETFARQYNEQADQLETRMSARVPIKGVLTFIDSKGNARRKGIDVGQELETRSFVEGASPSMAIWQYGVVPNPFDPERLLDRRIPVDRLLRRGTIEERANRLALLNDDLGDARARQQAPDLKAKDAAALSAEIKRLRSEIELLQAEVSRLQDEEIRLRALAAKDKARAGELYEEARALHSPPIPMEMTFSVYRTTKGVLGEPVHASVVVRNPRPDIAPHRDFLPIHEYYTDRVFLPSKMLVGSKGYLTVEVQCLSPNQYLGMAESDMYLLARQGRFWDNYLRGLFGIWLQAMILTAIGVFAGSFLSWPVALVTTLAFFVAGQTAFSFLQVIAMHTLQGGGPFESLIRLLSHDNLQTELAPTLGVIVAKTCDSLVMPILSRLVYIVPNFGALDVSNTVADGFAVTWPVVGRNLLLALGYVVPFSVAGCFILKNREVAA